MYLLQVRIDVADYDADALSQGDTFRKRLRQDNPTIKENFPMKLSINDDPARGPEIEIEEHCSDTFVVVNGLTIARRGPPDTPRAGIWVSLEPTNGLSDLHHDQRSSAKERTAA
jgi:hypothetical protein